MSGCVGQIPGACPSRKAEVFWDDWILAHAFYPLCAQAVLNIFFFGAVGPLYTWLSRRKSWFRDFVRTYVGTGEKEVVPKPRLQLIVFFLMLCSSAVSIPVWVLHTYWHTTSETTRALLFGAALVDVLHWSIVCLRNKFRVQCLWEANSLVDVLTAVPSLLLVIYPDALRGGSKWLSLHFLRPFAMLFSFLHIQKQGLLKSAGVTVQKISLAALRLFCLVVVMAGVIFTSEALGEHQSFADSFIETPAGDKISVLQMVYFVVITITTVGYGDFAPRTVISRVLTSCFIVVGFCYVFWIQFSFSQAWSQWREGSGIYRPRRKGDAHVVVILCLRGRAVQFSSMVQGFLREILHSSRTRDWPNVVIFSPTLWDCDSTTATTFEDFLKDQGFSKAVQSRVTFIVGDLASQADLDRAAVGTSTLTFLVSDVNSDTPDRDDEQNIFTALILREFYPDVRLRLMLLRPQAKELAVQSGIEMTRCFSLRELKANILAQNVRCHGLVPMITGMLKSMDDSEKDYAFRVAATSDKKILQPSRSKSRVVPAIATTSLTEDPWVQLYVEGMEREIYGFELSEEYNGLTFGELVNAIYRDVGAIVIASYEGGQISICPQRTDRVPVATGQIFFAIASDSSVLDSIRLYEEDASHWRVTLLRARDAQLRKNHRDGPHVSAAQLMGTSLKRAILQQENNHDRDEGGADNSESDDDEQSEVGVESCSVESGTIWKRGLAKLQVVTRNHSGAPNGNFPRRRPSVDHDEAARMGVHQVRELRVGLRSSGKELVVVIICHGEVWQQVRTFVSSLRAQYLPVLNPVVVFAPTAPPPRMFEDCNEEVLFVQGECTKAKSLIEAGILEAGAVVVMTGEINKLEQIRAPRYRDFRTILCAQELECWCGLSKKEVFTTYELQDSASVRHLPKLMMKPALRLERFLEERAFKDDGDEDDDMDAFAEEDCDTSPNSAAVWTLPGKGKRRHSGDEFGNAEENDDEAKKSQGGDSILFHPRFAAGQVFSPELWGAMLGCMYHMPAIIELVEALVMPHRRGQHSFTWQIKVPPKYVGKHFGLLLKDLALGGWGDDEADRKSDPFVTDAPLQDNLGSCGRAVSDTTPNRLSGNSGKSSKGRPRLRRQPQEGPAVAMALYRKRDSWRSAGSGSCPETSETKTPSSFAEPTSVDSGLEPECTDPILAQGTGGHNFVVLAPHSNIELREDDLVLVLGSRRFGKKAFTRGLLRGSDQMAQKAAEKAATPAKQGDMTVSKNSSDGHSQGVTATRNNTESSLQKFLLHGSSKQNLTPTAQNSPLILKTPVLKPTRSMKEDGRRSPQKLKPTRSSHYL